MSVLYNLLIFIFILCGVSTTEVVVHSYYDGKTLYGASVLLHEYVKIQKIGRTTKCGSYVKLWKMGIIILARDLIF